MTKHENTHNDLFVSSRNNNKNIISNNNKINVHNNI